MSDSSWDDYLADGATTDAAAALEADVAPLVAQAETDTWQGDNAASWGDWNGEIADDAATYAQSELEYANEAYAAGFTEAGDAAVARAEISADTAADHGETAADYYGTASSEYDAAADGYGTAADTVETATSYDTTSYDTTSYDAGADTTSYDAGSSYDAGADTTDAV